MNTSNVTQNIKPSKQSAPFQLLIVAGALGLILPIVYPLVANGTLPASDAATVKNLFFDTLKSALPALLTYGGGGTVLGSLAVRFGKIGAQLAPGMITEATPNGEGIGASPAPDTTPTPDPDADGKAGGIQDSEAGK